MRVAEPLATPAEEAEMAEGELIRWEEERKNPAIKVDAADSLEEDEPRRILEEQEAKIAQAEEKKYTIRP